MQVRNRQGPYKILCTTELNLHGSRRAYYHMEPVLIKRTRDTASGHDCKTCVTIVFAG